MSDFNRIYAIFQNSVIYNKAKFDWPYKDYNISVPGSIDIWDNEGINSVRLDFDSEGNFTGIFIND